MKRYASSFSQPHSYNPPKIMFRFDDSPGAASVVRTAVLKCVRWSTRLRSATNAAFGGGALRRIPGALRQHHCWRHGHSVVALSDDL